MKKDENEKLEEYGEPSLEDFQTTEEELATKARKKEKRQKTIKYITLIIILALLVNIWGIFPRIMNIPSIQFLLKSHELSKDSDIQVWKEAVVTINGNGRKGTGFVVSAAGIIVTNFHVIDNMKDIQVSFSNGEIYSAEMFKENPENDLALLKVVELKKELSSLRLSEQKVKPNRPIYIIGNPLAHTFIVNEGTSGEMIRSSLQSEVLLIDVPVHSGNSGSPVLTKDGLVVGVVYATTEENKGLAIPAKQILELLDMY
ncbi:trypsin-like peptidase domain-containing protein [Sutcliffiella horikoshii]|uniref:Trypsin-like peptidase domain-containing protein n=1 Tax=Sutcliffiella horikoshii TaxID=79883 RepID=A0A5D4T6L5_9BACI|nr:serine protease [Sutcliffiella horikoshii]TYS70348.1 trypsin-like peptidase domain-containing protein [Sutcliffiella horikoshii]